MSYVDVSVVYRDEHETNMLTFNVAGDETTNVGWILHLAAGQLGQANIAVGDVQAITFAVRKDEHDNQSTVQ